MEKGGVNFGDLVVANRILANEDVVDAYGGGAAARNAGYQPYSPETWRPWEYWATRAGCAHLLSKKEARG